MQPLTEMEQDNIKSLIKKILPIKYKAHSLEFSQFCGLNVTKIVALSRDKTCDTFINAGTSYHSLKEDLELTFNPDKTVETDGSDNWIR